MTNDINLPENGYKDKETLEMLYHDEYMTQEEIGELFDKAHSTISRHMSDNNVRARGDYSRNKVYGKYEKKIHTNRKGYEVVHGSQPALLHRLLVSVEYSLDELRGMDVHHKNGCSFDNRPDNLELITPEEHGRINVEKRLSKNE